MEVVTCTVCPHQCQLKAGQTGRCRARRNVGGQIKLLTYGRPCAVHTDPIEKKPLYHFLPGSKTFSIGTPGCNLNCLNCQNASISQHTPTGLPAYDLPPRAIASAAAGCPSVSYTYTEPLVALEYVCDCAEACRKAGLRNVLVTAAYATPETARTLARVIDAANVDIKSLSDDFYHNVCGAASVKPVLDTLLIWREAGLWLEITTLLVPTLNDSESDLRALATWIKDNLGDETPLHLSQFFPTHRMTEKPTTPPETLQRAQELTKEIGLKHVYIGNAELPGGSDTQCAACGAVVLRRRRLALLEDRSHGGKCPACGRAVAGVWR